MKQLADLAGIPITTNLEKYLGIPILKGRVCNAVFDENINKMKKQLSAWKANSLSQAGRTVLINANLNAQTNYLMHSFLLPKGVLEQIDKVNKNFFWNKLPSQNYHPLISWNSICSPKQHGGLGIKLAKNMNEALQMKLL